MLFKNYVSLTSNLYSSASEIVADFRLLLCLHFNSCSLNVITLYTEMIITDISLSASFSVNENHYSELYQFVNHLLHYSLIKE